MSGSVFMPTPISPTAAEVDPSKHVNYVLGMVLGVDDFNQEFGYLAGREQLAARELAGSGVVRGLRVSAVTDAQKGPEVVVSAGVAITPEGRFVKVPLTQCAVLNDWIAQNHDELTQRALNPTTGTPKPVKLWVVLSYADQTTDLVPIPGEPCRTEEESMAASRVTDDFRLELRFDPPEQREQDAIGQYLAWLAQKLEVVDSGAPSLADFLSSIAVAAATAPKVVPPPSGSPASTPATPLLFGAPIFEPPTFSLKIPAANASQYLTEAIRLFATLRGEWMSFGAKPDGTPPNEDAVVLSQASFTIEVDTLNSSLWNVQSVTPVAFDESRRSRVLSLAYLQELILALATRAQRSVSLATPGVRYVVATAGTVTVKATGDATPQPTPAPYNGLNAFATADGEVTVSFAGPGDPSLQYVVKALPLTELANPDFVNPAVSLLAFPAPAAGSAPSFTLRVVNTPGAGAIAAVPQAKLVGCKLMIEVSAFGR